jgi:ubiquinone/menaquinone biosynthesis C-methylase UbiE
MMEKNNVEKTIETYEKTADIYFEKHNDINWIKNHADYFIENLSGNKILDIGSGPGRDAKYFSEKKLDVTVIDLTNKFIDISTKNVPSAKFYEMDLRKLDFPENSFDGLWVSASFLHVPKSEAEETLNGFNRVLKPDGLMYLSVKAGNDEKIVEREMQEGGTKFFAFYTKDELTKIIEDAGFKILKIEIEDKKSTWINIFARK